MHTRIHNVIDNLLHNVMVAIRQGLNETQKKAYQAMQYARAEHIGLRFDNAVTDPKIEVVSRDFRSPTVFRVTGKFRSWDRPSLLAKVSAKAG